MTYKQKYVDNYRKAHEAYEAACEARNTAGDELQRTFIDMSAKHFSNLVAALEAGFDIKVQP